MVHAGEGFGGVHGGLVAIGGGMMVIDLGEDQDALEIGGPDLRAAAAPGNSLIAESHRKYYCRKGIHARKSHANKSRMRLGSVDPAELSSEAVTVVVFPPET